jgi:3-oxoacyl-[acyl-carrier protein] reductase
MLEGKIALVTGAARGIGRATAVALGDAGATVIGIDLDQMSHHEKFGRGMVCDVRDPIQVQRTIAQIVEEFGPVDVLVNNAGIAMDALTVRMKRDEWDGVLETDLTAVFSMCRSVATSMMKARWGRIINITSVVGHSGSIGQVNYCAAKAGVAGMTRGLARELGPWGITVNCVAPGYIDTELTKVLDGKLGKRLIDNTPLGRMGMPHEVAQAVVFLANAAYVTGSTVHVNGGLHME